MNRIDSKGQGGALQVMAAVLVVAALGIFLFTTRTSTTSDNLDTVGTSLLDLNSALRLHNLHELIYPSISKANLKMSAVVSYSCSYGEKGSNHTFTISDKPEIKPDIKDYFKDYMSSAAGEYYVEIDCGNDKTIEINSPPSGQSNVDVSEIEMPATQEDDEKIRIRLHRWLEG